MAAWLNPPRPRQEIAKEAAPDKPVAKPSPDRRDEEDSPAKTEETDEPEEETPARPRLEARWVSLGSMDPESPYRLLVTLTNRGAAVERIELNHPEYRDVDETTGYLGHLALTNEPGGGCRVNVVGAGTPAALAKPATASVGMGLKVGDVILAADKQPIAAAEDLARYLGEAPLGKEYQVENGRKPGAKIELTVRRQMDEQPQTLAFTVTLADRPVQIIQPEWGNPADPETRSPPSFLLTLESIDKKSISSKAEEIAGLPSLYEETWETQEIKDGVEFRFRLDEAAARNAGQVGPLEIVKRYRLVPASGEGEAGARQYHLDFDLEIHNLGDEPREVAYRLNGPNGLPLEGWWYLTKIHPDLFASAGTRDVIWDQTNWRSHEVLGCPYIVKQYEKERRPELFTDTGSRPSSDDLVVMANAGVDAQYFASALIPSGSADEAHPTKYAYQRGWAVALEEIDKTDASRRKTTNVSYRLVSVPHKIAPGEQYQETFTLFAGPKHPDVMDVYGLSDYIEYGWFWWVSRPMVLLLHFFEKFLFNYGLAIVLLTVLVRGAMYPLGRRAAMNAKKMQELAPEMKVIAEKYKNDMQKRAEAQQELFRKHNYHPLSGCAPLILQLPIFLGLYRALAVDIELRGASLIPGLAWCSNLAGPDMLWFWEPYMPGFLADPARGWLGPYFNLLPMVTIVLFLVHQKLFMPPATDDQTRLQQQVMTFMMVFMGVMFFRVPAGLCVYFIVSSLWGIFERTVLLPKTPIAANPAVPPSKDEGKEPKKSLFNLGGNGSEKPLTPKERRKQRQKRR